MSLSRLALRVATVKALTNATMAGPRVFDSAVDPIDLQVKDNRLPFITVLTEEHDREITGRDLRMGPDTCELVIEVAVASKVEVDTGDLTEIVIPHTDAGMEIALDVLGHEIIETLQASPALWARRWRAFVLRVTKIVSRRGAGSGEGVRFAARQITFSLDLLADPIKGETLPEIWEDMLATMEGDPDLNGASVILRHALAADTDFVQAPNGAQNTAPSGTFIPDEAATFVLDASGKLPASGLAASALGIEAATVEALGLGETLGEGGGESLLAEILTTPAPVLSMTEADVEEQLPDA